MLSFITPESHPSGVPSWWSGTFPVGHAVELEVYGDRMVGRLREADGDTLRVSVPSAAQSAGLRLSISHGTAVISMDGGAARVPVSCWATGDLLKLQVIGPIEFIQRRLHTRFPLRIPVRLSWLRAGDRAWDYAASNTVDLSLGGARIAPATTVWPGRDVRVHVQFDLLEGPCQVEADVVGTTPDYGLRLRFIELPAEAAAQITRLTEGSGGSSGH